MSATNTYLNITMPCTNKRNSNNPAIGENSFHCEVQGLYLFIKKSAKSFTKLISSISSQSTRRAVVCFYKVQNVRSFLLAYTKERSFLVCIAFTNMNTSWQFKWLSLVEWFVEHNVFRFSYIYLGKNIYGIFIYIFLTMGVPLGATF